ncbi:MAG: mercury(II) reductase [Rhodothermales bacterium]
MNRILELDIEGMTCGSCARHATEALEAVPGVEQARIDDWRTGRATVRGTNGIDHDGLVSAIARAGYQARVLAERPAQPHHPVPPSSESGDSAGVYDLVVIGGGSASFAAAIKASELGGRVAIVNDGLPIGGTCVNVGCVPSKTMIRAAEAHHRSAHHSFEGITSQSEVTDFAAVTRQTQALVAELRQKKYVDVVADDPNITIIQGRASLASEHLVEVNGQRLNAKNILIATGARTFVPDIPGLDEVGYLTNETVYRLEEQLEHLIVLGGRYIALENAQLFARLGSKVTVLQRSARILPTEAADMTDALTGYLSEEGIDVRTGVAIDSVRHEGDEVVVETRIDGTVHTFRGSHLLLATGRQGNTEGLGLEALGIRTDQRGYLPVDETLRTAVPTIFGAGDVLGEQQFVYTAAYEGNLAAANALGRDFARRDYRALPWVVFTDPQVAGVGMDETQAETTGIDFEVSKLNLDQVPRAIAARDTRGFIKLLRDRTTDRLIGARILAPEGSELLMEVALAIKYGITIQELVAQFHPYLTLSEGIKLAAITFGKDIKKLSCCAA